MNEEEQWQQGNDNYLAAALAWLRLLLEQQIHQLSAAPQTPEPTAVSSGSKWWQRRRAGAAGETDLSTLSPQQHLAAEVNQAAEAMTAAAAMEPPPALLILSQRFGLSPFEQGLLLLCVALELDTGIAGLCARAQDDAHRPYPTFALAMALFADAAWDSLSPERPLRYWRLIEINQPGAQPLTTSAIRADERILNYIKGLNYLDDRLTPLLVPFDLTPLDESLPISQQTAVDLITHQLQLTAGNGPPPVTQLVGIDSLSQQLVAQHAAAALNLHINRLPAELLPTQPAELETLARLWQRENFLLPIALYLDAHQHEDTTTPKEGGSSLAMTSPLRRFLGRSQGVFFLGTREVLSGLGPTATVVEVNKPTPAEQQAAWTAVVEDEDKSSPTLLAGQFNLNIATIRQIGRRAWAAQAASPEANGHLPHDQLWQACLVNTRPQMNMLAELLNPKATWDDIVLPPEAEQLLRQIAAQVRQRSIVYDDWGFRQKMNRGLGINALFAGDSGTGKTMAAEVIANELNLNLYRIDLSAVVSKYIGETEKNLRRLFDAAEDGGAILFFDEADALFGKRSEVKDSHDRYANIEINYLLQRMEAYRGLAILASNMKTALDQAFMRRLRFIVNFPFPSPKERALIWQKVFPPQTPLAKLDFDRLGRFNLTGGSINNIALNAAFMAARQSTTVTMPLVLAAARAEFRKLEKPVNDDAFAWEVTL